MECFIFTLKEFPVDDGRFLKEEDLTKNLYTCDISIYWQQAADEGLS